MQLSRLTAGLLVLAVASACHDTSAPFAPFYALVAVDGHALPVSYYGLDGGSTLLSGTLVLDPVGHALRIDHYRDFSANGGGMISNRDEKLSGPYTIANDSITVQWTSQGQCGPGPCLPNDIGAVSDSIVTLTADFGARTSPVYTYRLLVK
ncbi:MAG: hypothetical protein ACXU9O_09960 [Gemmatimonadaceae bacterium]